LSEVSKKLVTKLRLPQAIAEEYVGFLRGHAEVVVPLAVNPGACRDPADEMVRGLIEPGRIDVIVTGDKDLLVVKRFGTASIVTPRQFWEWTAEDRLLEGVQPVDEDRVVGRGMDRAPQPVARLGEQPDPIRRTELWVECEGRIDTILELNLDVAKCLPFVHPDLEIPPRPVDRRGGVDSSCGPIQRIPPSGFPSSSPRPPS
jgi:hypothetical protein